MVVKHFAAIIFLLGTIYLWLALTLLQIIMSINLLIFGGILFLTVFLSSWGIALFAFGAAGLAHFYWIPKQLYTLAFNDPLPSVIVGSIGTYMMFVSFKHEYSVFETLMFTMGRALRLPVSFVVKVLHRLRRH